MLKRLLNCSERITYGRLRDVCARRAAEVYAKVRLADVLPIEGSGLSVALYDFALQAHYDFVVTGSDQVPLFAVEFDGPQHAESLQAARDAKKDELSRRFDIPLLRVQAGDLSRSATQLDRLTELIETWFEEYVKPPANDRKPKCPLCGSAMIARFGRYGRFLSCVRYPACTGSCDLPQPRRGPHWKRVLIGSSICAVCLAAILALLFGFQQVWPPRADDRPLHGKTPSKVADPNSSMTLQEKQAYVSTLKESDYPLCPRCGKQMVIRRHGRTGVPFFGCSQFPDCRGARDVQYPK